MKKPKKKPEDTPMSVRFSDQELAELDTIVGWMKADPERRRFRGGRIGRGTAIRYAIGHIIDHPPEHVGVTGG